MVFASKTVPAFVLFCTIFSLASLAPTSEAAATKTRVIHLMPKAKAAPVKRAPAIHKITRKRIIIRKRKISPRRARARHYQRATRRARARHYQRARSLRPVVFGVERDNFRDSTTLGVPNVCSLKWHEVDGYGYRKVICKLGYRPHFPARRPWAYENFAKTANWRQSRSWGGHFHPHNLYQGNLEITDHGREFQGNPYRYLDKPHRYEQSTMFSQKIYYPPAPWQ